MRAASHRAHSSARALCFPANAWSAPGTEAEATFLAPNVRAVASAASAASAPPEHTARSSPAITNSFGRLLALEPGERFVPARAPETLVPGTSIDFTPKGYATAITPPATGCGLRGGGEGGILFGTPPGTVAAIPRSVAARARAAPKLYPRTKTRPGRTSGRRPTKSAAARTSATSPSRIHVRAPALSPTPRQSKRRHTAPRLASRRARFARRGFVFAPPRYGCGWHITTPAPDSGPPPPLGNPPPGAGDSEDRAAWRMPERTTPSELGKVAGSSAPPDPGLGASRGVVGG